jgi:O-antigen ligase
MTSDTRDRAIDLAIAASLALFPLLPTGPTYLGLDWPWALDLFFLIVTTLGLAVVLTAHRGEAAVLKPAAPGVRLVRRGYVTWLIPVAAAMAIGVLERNPFDGVLLRVEADGLPGRLVRPMDQAADPFYPVRVGLTCLEGGLMFALLSAVLTRTRRPRRRIRAAAHGCLLGLALVSVVAIVQYFTRANLLDYWVRANPGLTRSHGTLDDPNALASFLVLGIGLAVGVAWARPGKWVGPPRVGVLIVAALACGALLTTVSRAGWAALILAALVVAAMLPERLIGTWPLGRSVRRLARGGAVFLVGAVAVWAAAAMVLPKRSVAGVPDTPLEAALQTIDPRESLETVLKRRHLVWRAGLQVASAHPVFGAGLGQFPRALAAVPGSDGPENAHNYFLQTLAETGAVGLAALLLLLLAMALAAWVPTRVGRLRPARFAVGLSMGLLAFVLTWLTGHPLLTLSNQLWLASVLAVGLAAVQPLGAPGPGSSDSRGRVRQWFLHPAWVPAVAIVTLIVAVPRAIAAVSDDNALMSHAAGVYGWETSPPTEGAPAGRRFRWTSARAALREPVRGAVLTVPLYVARPDMPARAVTLHVTVGGMTAAPVILATNGWHVLTYDLIAVLGEARWRSDPAITLEFRVSPPVVPAEFGASDDTRELGVGLGEVLWSGARPGSGDGQSGRE